MRRLEEVWENAKVVEFDDNSKFVVMSDCHRGIANWGDNFAANEHLFYAALNDYYKNGYAYIELGDGDELWENRCMGQIMRAHQDIFRLMSLFYQKNRFLMLYGNHDRCKEDKECVCRCLRELFPGIEVAEGVRLRYRCNGEELFLTHGHQGDLLNDTLWVLGRFLVRYIWRPMELFGLQDPTDAGKNYKKANRVERKLKKWVEMREMSLVSGHTHRPHLPKQLPGYFNTGSAVHPRCITAIEIADGEVFLVKWVVIVSVDKSLKVKREVMDGPLKLVRCG